MEEAYILQRMNKLKKKKKVFSSRRVIETLHSNHLITICRKEDCSSIPMNNETKPNILSMESKWRASPHLGDTAIWMPDNGYKHIKLIRKWNKLSRLQRSLIFVGVGISFLLARHFLFDKVFAANVHNNGVVHKINAINTNLTLVTQQKDTKRINTNLDINEVFRDSYESGDQTSFSGARNARQLAVVNSFKHAWTNYKKYAWGRDTLQPLSMSGKDWFSLGLTLVDSLDTAYIMGLMDEFKDGRDWVESELRFTQDYDVNLFEVTIRVLGALLANYHLSKDQMFLTKAEDLGNRLLGAFTSPSGIPFSDVNLSNQKAHAPDWSPYSSTAEVTTLQLEFRELSRATGNPKYEEAAAQVSDRIHSLPKKHGLVPIFISPHTGNFASHATITLGARGDSYYEYLLKQWIQTGKTIDYLKEDYLSAIDGVRAFLVRKTSYSKLVFIGELTGSETFNPKMDHLTCFLPGTLALGYSHGLPDWHLEMAQDLLYTCYMTYAVHPTFLSPEITYFHLASETSDMYTKIADSHSLLRPEFVESLWYMYQITGNTTYQEWGWNVYQAFEKYARADTGYCSLDNINKHPTKRDSMESFFLAETLKYLYMLFSNDRYMIDLKKFVINSEAHPLPVHTM